MKWKDLRPGVIVYHNMFTTRGKGTVIRVLGVDALTSLFERGRWRAEVQFEGCDGLAKMRASELRKTPNRKKINDMMALYKRRGIVAIDCGDKLVLPLEK